MEKPPVYLVFLMTLLFPLSVMGAEFFGELKLNRCYLVEGSVVPADFTYHQLYLKLDEVGENYRLYASTKLRLWDQNYQAQGIEDLSASRSTSPYELILWEAYAEIYGLFSDKLELKVGRQRIAWGTADRLNPTDNLNPDDFSDPLDFGEKVPTEALLLTYYLTDEYALNLLWLPTFKPTLFPRGKDFCFLSDQAIPDAQQVMVFPERRLTQNPLAVKLSGKLRGWDFSLSYFRGYDDLLIVKEMKVDNSGQTTTTFGFPKLQVWGLDFAGEFHSIGFWGEAGAFLPEEVRMQLITPLGTQDSLLLPHEVYLKSTLGCDYTFKEGTYVNFQWNHGFYTERGRDSLHDYFFARAERRFRQDEVKLGLGGALELADWESLKGNMGSILIPELTLYPFDNVEVGTGGFFIWGKATTLFGSWRDKDQVFARLKISF